MMDDAEMLDEDAQSGSSSIGEAVSGRGQNVPDGDDDVYYIPERRPSLDLGPNPMDLSDWHHEQQASHPALSYWSMTSDDSSDKMDDDDEDESCTRVELTRADSFSSSYSLDSDDCEKRTDKAKSKEDAVSEPVDMQHELPQDSNKIQHPSLTVAFTFKAISKTLEKLSPFDIKAFKTLLWKRHPNSFNTSLQGIDLVDLVDRLLESFGLVVSLEITEMLLKEIGQKRMSDYLQNLCIRNEVRYDLSETLKRTYGEVCEDLAVQREKRPFDDVFTDLSITSTCDNGPNIEHEVMTIEKLDSNLDAGEQLSIKDILSAEFLENSNIKLLLMSGVAGSGKTMAVRKLVLDWIKEQSHQHVSFLFPLPFRELRQFEGCEVSLLDIVQKLYPETKKLKEEDYRCEDCKMIFIFDGLDEYNGKFDFNNTELLCNHTDRTSLNVIVVNLLRGRLLYHGLFLITSRSQVNRSIPWDTRYDEIDVCGFCDPQKDEYFKKRFQDPGQAARVIEHINSLKTLRIMCHLPLFCSLVAGEYEHIFRKQGTQAELPRSITYMYTKLLLVLIRQKRAVRAPDRSQDEERDFLMKLGKLAFTMLEKGQFKITKCDWKEFGISDDEAVNNSGLCTQYMTKPHVLFQEKVLSFIHPTMQEYLAALYAFLSFINQGKNVFDQQLKGKIKVMFKGHKMMELYKNATERSLQHEDGKLDIFLRFLCGMTLKTNLELLQPFCASAVKPAGIEDVVALIKKKLKDNQYPNRNSNLQHCLEELGM